MRCAGALLPLVSMLQGSDTDLQSQAADIMLRIAIANRDDSSFDAIMTAGNLQAVILQVVSNHKLHNQLNCTSRECC